MHTLIRGVMRWRAMLSGSGWTPCCSEVLQSVCEWRANKHGVWLLLSPLLLLLPLLHQTGGESAAGVLSSMLLLPGDFQPQIRTNQHNSCVHKILDSQDVKVRHCGKADSDHPGCHSAANHHCRPQHVHHMAAA